MLCKKYLIIFMFAISTSGWAGVDVIGIINKSNEKNWRQFIAVDSGIYRDMNIATDEAVKKSEEWERKNSDFREKTKGGSGWIVENTKKVMANGWNKEVSVKCVGGAVNNNTETILVLNSGRYKYVYGSTYDTLDGAAKQACRISD